MVTPVYVWHIAYWETGPYSTTAMSQTEWWEHQARLQLPKTQKENDYSRIFSNLLFSTKKNINKASWACTRQAEHGARLIILSRSSSWTGRWSWLLATKKTCWYTDQVINHILQAQEWEHFHGVFTECDKTTNLRFFQRDVYLSATLLCLPLLQDMLYGNGFGYACLPVLFVVPDYTM